MFRSSRPSASVEHSRKIRGNRWHSATARANAPTDSERFIAATSRTEHGYGSFLGTQLDEPNIIILVAERDGEVIGYTYAGVEGNDYMSLRGPAGVLYDIVVDPASRGHGVGRMLLDATMDALKAKGAPRVSSLDCRKKSACSAPVRSRRVPADDDRDDSRAERLGL